MAAEDTGSSMMNLSTLLENQADRFADKPFILFERQPHDERPEPYGCSLSYGGFNGLVNQTAGYLRSIGIEKGDIYNVHLPNCITFLALWFAGARLGAVMMPTNVLSSRSELEYLLNHSGAKVSFCAARDLAVLQHCVGQCRSLQRVVTCDPYRTDPAADSLEAMVRCMAPAAVSTAVAGSDLAAIMYTSGTTSKPKGVMVTHANYLKAGRTVADAIDLRAEDRQFVVLPLFHGNAQYYSFMSALLRGASVALMDRFSAAQYMSKCRQYRCTVASLFAAPMRMILAQPENKPDLNNRLRIVIYAQNLTEEQMRAWRRRFRAPICQLWGMTETMGPPLMNPLHGERRNHSLGKPIGGYRIRLVDESGHPVKQGDRGEIVVQGNPGETLMKGYFQDSKATGETLKDGWLYTGDQAFQDAQGYYYFVDRAKDMIKRAGENVAASEVESVILQHPAVFDCAVVGLPDAVRDEQIVAVVVLQGGHRVSADDLIEFCRTRLAKFRVPSRVVFQTTLPRTSVGKIQKHLIRRELLALSAPPSDQHD